MLGEVQIRISSDVMQASACLCPGEHQITEEYVIEKIREAGVSMGILAEKVTDLVNTNAENHWVVVAEGRAPGETVLAYVEYFFDRSHEEDKTSIDDKGRVHYGKNRIMVSKGDKLAMYHRSISGPFGYTVMSTVIAPKPVHEFTVRCKGGVEQIDECFYATVDGEVVVDDTEHTIMVNNVLEIDGDAKYGVDSETDFIGDVHIKGDVLAGVSINAHGSIEIDGIVEACKITAGKDVIIHGGVHGDMKAIISAGGNIVCPFVESATLFARNNIQADYVMTSTLKAETGIIVQGQRGAIIGGVTTAGKLIEVTEVGNEVGVLTRLEIKSDDLRNISFSKVVIHDKAFDNVRVSINDVEYRLYPKSQREFHLVSGIVDAYEIGSFVAPNHVSERFITPKVKKTILLVDDEPIILKTFFSFLSDKYEVLLSSSGKDALKLLDKRPKVPDLILLDYKMPVMDGAELLSTIRKSGWKNYYNVPVIFVSAVTDKEAIAKCLVHYPQGYMLKPIGKEELVNAVDKFFYEKEL